MDFTTLWNLTRENANHIEIMNREMGCVQQSIEWLTWISRFIFVGIILTAFNGFFNTYLIRKNGNGKK